MKSCEAIQLVIVLAVLIEIIKCGVSDKINLRKLCQFHSADICLPNYYYFNGLCYPIKQTPICSEVLQPCTFLTTTRKPTIVLTTTTPTTPTSETTLSTSEPMRCPFGSIFFKETCRKIICPFGEYDNGLCLQAICPQGTVWNGHSCQKPRFITTILEIDNVFLSETQEHRKKIERVNINKVEYNTENTTPSTIPNMTTESLPLEIVSNACCTVFTPRICKKYGKKWICFNNRLKRCNPDICKYSTMYLKIPKVIYEPPILILPPNPPLESCPVPNCDVTDIIDCSGCAEGRRERCSSYCYQYICPKGTCGYIDHQDFCKVYPTEVGCTKKNGCIWIWCAGNE